MVTVFICLHLGSSSYAFDPLTGGVTQVTMSSGNAVQSVLHHAYDPATGRLKETWTDDNDTSYRYDPMGRLSQVIVNKLHGVRLGTSQSPARTTTYAYDPVGGLDLTTFDNGTPADPSDDLKHDYAYDALNRLDTLTVRRGTTTLFDQDYDYESDGQKDKVTEHRGSVTTAYDWTYDALNRLTDESYTNSGDAAKNYAAHYAFDLAGNRVGKTQTGADAGTTVAGVLRPLVPYLTTQVRLWPELRKKGVLPSPDDAVAVAAMAAAFKERHVSSVVVLPPKSVMALFGKVLASAYSRFSHINSKPTSIIDQLARELAKAKEQGYFIPWEFVFADYAVTGLDRHRSGYTAAKTLMAMENVSCARLYIDDFTRASRDEIEWWKLGALLKRLKKNLIGASDGFELLSENGTGEIMIWVYSLLSRLFLKGLREKVRRGRDGAIRRG